MKMTKPRSPRWIVSVLTPSTPSRHSSVARMCKLAPACNVCGPLKSMTVHRLYIFALIRPIFDIGPHIFAVQYLMCFCIWPISCIGPHVLLSIISCIGPHVLLSIIPHAWEIFLEMLTVDRHWEFYA